MLDEELDHIIREAADKHHPPYNDKAWEKMELLLNRHLPQKRDRKKFIFFLLFYLLLGGAFFYTVMMFVGNKDPGLEKNAAIESPNPSASEAISKQNRTATDKTTEGPGNTYAAGEIIGNDAENGDRTTLLKDLENDPGGGTDGIPVNFKKFKANSKGKTSVSIVNAKAFSGQETADAGIAKRNPNAGKTGAKLNISITGALAEDVKDETITSGATALKNQENLEPGVDEKAGPEQLSAMLNKEGPQKEPGLPEDSKPSAPGKKKPKTNIAGNFGLTFSIGPDLSFVNLNKPGKVTLLYGAGLSYNFGKRITARAGFYASKKIYTATPAQYHTPGGVNYPYLTGVDADCKVYEIPISFSYNFGQRHRHNWFGNIGLSSFIMKTESYDYNYKYPSGQAYTYHHKISNENKHYFAVLTVSGGYNYQINKRIAVQAEPFVKLPLGGIGLGKIKLNSSGILFTATVKPFAKKQ
jgi:hypothetical protein